MSDESDRIDMGGWAFWLSIGMDCMELCMDLRSMRQS